MDKDAITIDIGSYDPYSVEYFNGGSGNITCAVPFFSPPVEDEEFRSNFSSIKQEVWIDNMILSSAGDAQKYQNITALIEWAKLTRKPISLTMAIYEKYRTNSRDPFHHILKSVKSLNQSYGLNFDENEIKKNCRAIASRSIHHNDFENLTNCVIFFRYIFHLDFGYEEKINKYADYVCKYLLPSTTAFLIAALFFYLKEYPDDFKPVRTKLIGDMKVTGDYQADLKKAKNVASDIGLFTYASWPRFDISEGVFPVISIATCDTLLSFILEQICHCELYVQRGVNLQTPAYRPESVCDKKLANIVLPLMRKFRESNDRQDQRSANTKKVSELILLRKFKL